MPARISSVMDFSTSCNVRNVYAILAQSHWAISLPENPPGALVSRMIPGDFIATYLAIISP